MKSTRFILFLFVLSWHIQPFAQTTEVEEIEIMPSKQDDLYYSMIEQFNTDGTYVKSRKNGQLVASGFHIDKKLNGELKTYNRLGAIEKTEHYKNGNLDGISSLIYDSLITTKVYSEGNQVDFETVYKTRDLTHPIAKMGPYFSGEKKQHVFTIFKEERTEESIVYIYDTLMLSALNTPKLKRLITQTNQKTFQIDTLLMAECIFLDQAKESYSYYDLNTIIHLPVVSTLDLGYRNPKKGTEVKAFYNDGRTKYHLTPNLRLTYYPSGQLNDSIINQENQPYYFYRFLENGELLFKSSISVNENTDKTTRLFDYFSKNKPLYTITSINYRPDRITTMNDSVLSCIKKGEYIDYYGTHYITQPDGFIDTSFTKERFPYRYENDLPQGNFYFFTQNSEFKKLSIDKNSVTITEIDLGKGISLTPRTQHIIYKIDSVYHLYESVKRNWSTTKLSYESGTLYALNYTLKDESSVWNEEQLFNSAIKDTIGKNFKSALFTEEEYQNALNYKAISTMKKSIMKKCLEEYQELHKVEKEYTQLLYNEKVKFDYHNRQLRWVFYQHKFNPFYTKDQFESLMKSYELTDDEKKEFKKLIRY